MQELGEQAPPAVHGTHDPPLHTWLVPHVWPLATLPVETHTEAPVEQSVLPVWQLLATPPVVGVQATPAVHATQLPPEQTWLLPQLVPSATLVPVAAQTDDPEAHVVDPFWHTLPFGWQVVPVMHATQLPPLHT